MLDPLDRRQVVLRLLLEQAAAQRPHDVFVEFEDGSSWTYAEALGQAAAAAHELRGMGVMRSSSVAVALPNDADYLRAWWGAALLGAALIPVNTALRGDQITHLLDRGAPAVLVSSGGFRHHLLTARVPSSLRIADPAELRGSAGSPPLLDRPIEPWEPALLGLTSGSTGVPKLVRITHAQSRAASEPNFHHFGIGREDVYLADIAMVHVSALYVIHAALAHGTRIVMRRRPQLDHYWEVAREAGATMSQLYSTMISFLDTQPRRGAERDHRLRVVITVPLPPDPAAFAERFGIAHLSIGYGATEMAAPIGSRPTDPLPRGSTGTLLPGWQVRLVDEHDRDVPAGEPGEAVVRSETPWLVTTEYVGDPAATARAWRNGWFHTGDLLRRDDAGHYYFVDRSEDAIRRRGENISSSQVETALRSFPGIADVAVVRTPSMEGAEDEVKAWLKPAPDAVIDFEAVIEHCAAHLAHFMVPRYLQVIEELPRTASMKVRKNVLRDLGNDSDTWDRLDHGIDVTRHGVVRWRSHPDPDRQVHSNQH